MAKTVLIFEGARGAGKTTVLNAVHERLKSLGVNVSTFKAERGEHPWVDMRNTVREFEAGKKSEVVLVDRFHLTEAVMRIADKSSRMEDMVDAAYGVDADLLEVGAVTIILFCSDKELDRRIAERNDGRGHEVENARAVWRSMGMLFSRDRDTTVTALGTEGAVDSIVDYIVEFVVWRLK